MVCGIGGGMDRSLARIAALAVDIVILTDRVTDAVRRAAAEVVVADPCDPDGAECAVRANGIDCIDGILSLGLDNPPTVARLCRVLGCAGLDEETARNCTEKNRRIAILDRNGFRTPRYATAACIDDALEAVDAIGAPVVVKPADRSESLGVAKIDDRAAAPGPIREALRLSRSGQVVIEEFLIGSEHTVAGIALGDDIFVTGFSDRDYSQKERFAPYFFERGEIVPTALPPSVVDEVLHTVTRGVRVLRLTPAVFNADVMVTDAGEVALIELAGRITGARIATEVIPLATGVDILPNAVRLALGRPLDLSELAPTRAEAAVMRYLPAQGGTVEWVGDIGPLAKLPGIYDLAWCMPLRTGDRLPLYRTGHDVIASVIAHAPSRAEAETIADRALARLPLRMRDVDWRAWA